MSVSLSGNCLAPSSSLPSIRSLAVASEDQIATALKNLQILYCPVRLPTIISDQTSKREQTSIVSPPEPVDSGYASQDEDDDDKPAAEEVTAALCMDPFERTFATKWLTSLIACAEELEFDENARERIVDHAGFILSKLFDSPDDEEEEEAITRDFSFPTSSGHAIEVTLNDAPLSATDHTAVGLQSWGASIVLSSMICADPDRFGFNQTRLHEQASITELGAGTGLVSLVLAKLLPVIGIEGIDISATDYHPAVLDNCKANIDTNFSPTLHISPPVETAILDWAEPPAHLKSSLHLLIASDVVYAPEHANLLRDCAAHLLAPTGTFWLMVTVRKTGKFEGIPDTVETVFAEESCPKNEFGATCKILESEFVEKRRGIGRGDESGYNLYKIGWAKM